MRLSESIKPISYIKSHAAEIIRHFEEDSAPIIITQNGEAKAVLQDIRAYEELQESLIMLKILALSKAEVKAGKTKPLKEAFADIRKRINLLKENLKS